MSMGLIVNGNRVYYPGQVEAMVVEHDEESAEYARQCLEDIATEILKADVVASEVLKSYKLLPYNAITAFLKWSGDDEFISAREVMA